MLLSVAFRIVRQLNKISSVFNSRIMHANLQCMLRFESAPDSNDSKGNGIMRGVGISEIDVLSRYLCPGLQTE